VSCAQGETHWLLRDHFGWCDGKPDPKAGRKYQVDPESLRGRDPKGLEEELDHSLRDEGGWTKDSLAKGDGNRYYDGKGNSIEINQGYPAGLRGGQGDSIHEGPYLKISPQKNPRSATREPHAVNEHTDKTFELEALEWALDEDSVQALLIAAERDGGLSRVPALAIVIELAKAGYFELYESTDEAGKHVPVNWRNLTPEYLSSRAYTWMSQTDTTIPRIKTLYKVLRERSSV